MSVFHQCRRLLPAVCLFTLFLRSAQADERPLNVLLITSDDLGPQLSCYGNRVIQTPHLDALAKAGVRFEVAWVTQASCSPSRSSMFTGLYPHATGQYGLMTPGNEAAGFGLHEELRSQTMPALLKAAGYRTGIIGKLHVAPQKSFPFDARPGVNTRQVRKVAEAAADFFAREREAPFFLMVNYSDPHASRTNRQSSDWHFLDQVDGLPEDPLQAGEAPAWPFQRIDDPAQLKKIAGYFNCVRRLDDGVGMLLKALEAAGERDRTLILFVGDHGPPFARGKTTCYEAGLRVPFLVCWPGVTRPGVQSAMVSTVDLLPTILDAAGAPIPGGLHGRSLRPVLENDAAPWREFLGAEFHFHGRTPFYPRRSVRDRRYHLIHNLRAGQAKPSTGIDGDKALRMSQQPKYDGTPTRTAFETFADPPEYELYDLEADPAEMNNLADEPDHEDELQRMQQALLQWRRRTSDILLDPAKLQELAN